MMYKNKIKNCTVHASARVKSPHMVIFPNRNKSQAKL